MGLPRTGGRWRGAFSSRKPAGKSTTGLQRGKTRVASQCEGLEEKKRLPRAGRRALSIDGVGGDILRDDRVDLVGQLPRELVPLRRKRRLVVALRAKVRALVSIFGRGARAAGVWRRFFGGGGTSSCTRCCHWCSFCTSVYSMFGMVVYSARPNGAKRGVGVPKSALQSV